MSKTNGRMRRATCAAVAAAVLLTACWAIVGGQKTASAVTPETGQVPPDPPWLIDQLPQERQPGDPWCLYPLHTESKAGTQARAAKAVVDVDEVEPNDLFSEAQFLSVDSTLNNEVDITAHGTIAPGDDLDHYQISLDKGDILCVSVWLEEPLDPTVKLYDIGGNQLIANDDHGFLAFLYPPESPFIGGREVLDSSFTFIAPATANYVIEVASFASASNGDYRLKVMARRPSFEDQSIGDTQIIYIDFNGTDDFNAVAAFGGGMFATELAPLQAFLPNWGLTWEDEAAVVDAILEVVYENFEDLRSSGINGDRDSTFIDGDFDIEFRNSRDHPDPWGQPNVSRVVVGGTINQLGIATLGIAQSIDPGNFAREESAVVLLDFLSGPAEIELFDPNDPGDDDEGDGDDGEGDASPVAIPNLDSINALPLSNQVDIIDAIGRVIGNIVSHEAGHYLGLWHTDHSNDIPCLIDVGGNGIADEGEVGPDGIVGTGDDTNMRFIPDEYAEYGLFGITMGVAEGTQLVDVRTAYALSTGMQLDVEPPPPAPEPEQPRVSISTMPDTGYAPLEVTFAGGGIDPDGGEFLIFNWDFGDGSTGKGDFVTHTYESPGIYQVTLSAVTSNATTAQATVEMVVLSEGNNPPMVDIVASPTRGDTPLAVVFEASAIDTDGSVVKYEWDFGDGSTATGFLTEHVYTQPGNYVATVTVTDNFGATQSATQFISVAGAPIADGIVVPGGSNDSGAPLPGVESCGTGTGAAMAATLTLMLGASFVRRRRH